MDQCLWMNDMKILYINTYCNGSTGYIVNSISNCTESCGGQTIKCYGREKHMRSNWIYFGTNKFLNFISNFLTYVTGLVGSFHTRETKKLINIIEKEKPDIIHFHNIHGNYLNFRMIFNYLLKNYVNRVVFTLHDDFLYTGRCASAKCDSWQQGCKKCKYKNEYPHVLFDRANKLLIQKIQHNKTLKPTFVFPSRFMQNNFFLSLYSQVKSVCIPNGIDNIQNINGDISNVVKSCVDKNKINILCVAFPWNESKGISKINLLANDLDPNKYNIIVVGTNNKTKNSFSKKIIRLPFLQKNELIYLYSNCDFLLIASRRESFSLVTIEAMSCGLPVISTNTGAATELINNECGLVVDDRVEDLFFAINSFEKHRYSRDKIKKIASKFSINEMNRLYYDLYCDIMKK